MSSRTGIIGKEIYMRFLSWALIIGLALGLASLTHAEQPACPQGALCNGHFACPQNECQKEGCATPTSGSPNCNTTNILEHHLESCSQDGKNLPCLVVYPDFKISLNQEQRKIILHPQCPPPGIPPRATICQNCNFCTDLKSVFMFLKEDDILNDAKYSLRIHRQQPRKAPCDFDTNPHHCEVSEKSKCGPFLGKKSYAYDGKNFLLLYDGPYAASTEIGWCFQIVAIEGGIQYKSDPKIYNEAPPPPSPSPVPQTPPTECPAEFCCPCKPLDCPPASSAGVPQT